MRVIRAAEMGICFGVRDALDVTDSVPDPTQVTIHGELVHNPDVTTRLREAGFRHSPEDNRRPPARTPLVLITAHGVSQAERRRLSAAHEKVLDTTCPLVLRAHDAAVELQAEDRHVLLIGTPGHVEVRGLVGDLDSYDVVADPNAVRCYERQRLGIVSQTTMPPDLVAAICSRIQEHNPLADIRVIDTVCQPTRLRLHAVLDLVPRVNAVVVVGGRNSNNTRRLLQLCHEHRTPALHVERTDELNPDWFDNVQTVGLTAGTSTLDETVDEVHRALEEMSAY
ncbi:MAG: 4-hydroxy-3-methylbut-2-enyl diphosphate reductase [Vicinamibacterales bacterium]|jgi:4-hydroxy-3-methylbut-2-enyl diphosphate reductase|nr:4-hydroxy-3-methylbut-2-enyl diphosphate reductase [Vicinamibacterales bacterium]